MPKLQRDHERKVKVFRKRESAALALRVVVKTGHVTGMLFLSVLSHRLSPLLLISVLPHSKAHALSLVPGHASFLLSFVSFNMYEIV